MAGITDSIIQGTLQGFGNALGTFLAVKYVISREKKIAELSQKAKTHVSEVLEVVKEEGKR